MEIAVSLKVFRSKSESVCRSLITSVKDQAKYNRVSHMLAVWPGSFGRLSAAPFNRESYYEDQTAQIGVTAHFPACKQVL